MATDPVCGMYVDERTATLRAVADGRTYYFCATSCLESFTAPDAAVRGLARDLVLSAVLSTVVLVLQYGDPTGPAPAIEAILAGAVLLGPGRGFYRGFVDALRSRIANMDVLVVVGTTTAYAYGVVGVLAPGRFPAATYFDASSVIVTLLLAGNLLERRTRARASTALRSLRALLPPTVHRIDATGETDVPPESIVEGDRVRVRAGERVPADGRVRSGTSELDESNLTGESRPVVKRPGDRLIAGTLNGDGALELEVERLGAASFLGQIGSLLAEAESARVPLRERADWWASVFAPFVLLLAAGAALAWWLLGGAPPDIAVLVFVSVAITACPCAFGLATPAAILAGTGAAAESGVLFRGGDSLERGAAVRRVLFDKTGTLTEGRPAITGWVTAPGEDAGELLAVAVGLEGASTHPIAAAVRRFAAAQGVAAADVRAVRNEPGRGVVGTYRGVPYAVERCDPDSLDPGELGAAAQSADARGSSYALVRRGAAPVALLEYEDPVRPEAAEALQALQKMGIDVEIVSGDSRGPVDHVARRLGIAEFRAGLRPEEKVEAVRARQGLGERVAFVGDGVNDAAAIATADLGIALGTGSDVAQAAGQVLLVRADLRGVPIALQTARGTVHQVRRNLGWAVGYNAALLPVAAGVLVPLWGFGVYRWLPEVGALAMGLSSTFVVAGSLLLRWSLARAARPRADPSTTGRRPPGP